MDPSLQEAAGSPRLRAGLVALPGTLPPSCPAHSLSSLAFPQSDPRPARLSLQPQGLRLNRCYLKRRGCLLCPVMPTFRLFPSLLGLRPQPPAGSRASWLYRLLCFVY